MELKSGEGTVVVADRDHCCNDRCCNDNRGWGSGWVQALTGLWIVFAK